MDMIQKLLLAGICLVVLIIVVLAIAFMVTRRKEKRRKKADALDDNHSIEPMPDNVVPAVNNDKMTDAVDTANVALADPALEPLFEGVDFMSEETEGTKFEQFNTVAASEVAREIVATHEASGFRIIYKGCFTADVLMFKFYYIEVKDKEAEDGSVFYVIYESGVKAYGLYIGDDEEYINSSYLVNKQQVN